MTRSTDSIGSRDAEETRADSSSPFFHNNAGVGTWGMLLIVATLVLVGCDSTGTNGGGSSGGSKSPATRDDVVRLTAESETPTARDSIKFIYSIYAGDGVDSTSILDFGDGDTIEVQAGDYQNTYHAYNTDGEYMAVLETKNSADSTMRDSVRLSVQPEQPEAGLTVSTDRVEMGQEVTFTYSIDDPDDVIESATLEFGDGNSVPVQAGDDQIQTHTYNDIGELHPRIVINGDEFARTIITVFSNKIIQVEAGTGTIAAALEEAKPGVTLRLVTDGGIYREPGIGISTDNITIEAEEGLSEPPVVVYDENEFNNEFTFVRVTNPVERLTLKDFTIGREAGNTTAQPKNLFTTVADEARLDLYMHGMELRNVGNKIINNQNDSDPALYDSLVVTQSYFHHGGNNMVDLKANKTPNNDIITANYVEFENVTIANANQDKAMGFMTKGGKESPNKMEIRFNHVTIDKVKIGMNMNRTPVDCSFSEIKNTAITRMAGGSKPAIRWNGLCSITVENMVTYQTGGFGGGGNISSTESLEWDELLYRDPGAGDYGLQSGAPGTSSNQPATDGDDRGDLTGYDDSRTSKSGWMGF